MNLNAFRWYKSLCKPCMFLNDVTAGDAHGGRLLSTWTVSQRAPDSPAEPPRVWPESPAPGDARLRVPGSPSVSVPRICAVALREPHCSSHFLYANCKSLSHVRLSATPQAIQPMGSPGQSPGVGSLSLLQGIFPAQASNPGLPHCGQIEAERTYPSAAHGRAPTSPVPLPYCSSLREVGGASPWVARKPHTSTKGLSGEDENCGQNTLTVNTHWQICKGKPIQWGWSLWPELVETQTHTGSPATQALVPECLFGLVWDEVPATVYLKGSAAKVENHRLRLNAFVD